MRRGRPKGSKVVNGRLVVPGQVQLARRETVELPSPAAEGSIELIGIQRLDRVIELREAELEALKMALSLVRG